MSDVRGRRFCVTRQFEPTYELLSSTALTLIVFGRAYSIVLLYVYPLVRLRVDSSGTNAALA